MFIGNKKCRIYAACGVSQTPIDIHTSEEKLGISSTRRVWNYLIKVLEALKD